MSASDILNLSLAILASLGGGGVIVFALSSWLGKVWASRLMERERNEHAQSLANLRHQFNQETESYKIKLKKSEFIFQKEYEAASEFVALKASFMPEYRYPEMDWCDSCDDIAHNFEKIESALSSFLSRHGAILSTETKDLISNAEYQASAHKFDITGPEVPTSANKAADAICGEDGYLDKAEKALISQVHSQSSI